MKIPLSSPDITEIEIEAVAATLRSTSLSLGPSLLEFEAAFTRLTNVPYAIAVSSGTAGLHLAVRALDIGQGDEVIVPSFTFIAVANAVLYEQAIPVFVDIERESLNLSPSAVEQAITPRTRAIVAVHTFGRPADMAALRGIATRHGLALIEDACEAIGGEIEGIAIGSFGDIAVFAFYPNKQITTGEGGMVVTADAALADRMRALRNQGRGATDGWLQHSEVGYNYRLPEVSCTLGIGQINRLQSILERRRAVASLYRYHLEQMPELVLPAAELPGARLSWFVYVVRLNDRFTQEARDYVVDDLARQGIGCGRYFAPIHLQPAYRGRGRVTSLSVTESVASRTIALPFFNRLHNSEVGLVCSSLAAALERIKRSAALHTGTETQ